MESSRLTTDQVLHNSRERLTAAITEYLRRKTPRDVLFRVLYQQAGLKAEQEALKIVVGSQAFRKSGFNADTYLALVAERSQHQADLIAKSAGVIVTPNAAVLEAPK